MKKYVKASRNYNLSEETETAFMENMTGELSQIQDYYYLIKSGVRMGRMSTAESEYQYLLTYISNLETDLNDLEMYVKRYLENNK